MNSIQGTCKITAADGPGSVVQQPVDGTIASDSGRTEEKGDDTATAVADTACVQLDHKSENVVPENHVYILDPALVCSPGIDIVDHFEGLPTDMPVSSFPRTRLESCAFLDMQDAIEEERVEEYGLLPQEYSQATNCHNGPQEAVFAYVRCDICHGTFMNTFFLEKHMKLHKEELAVDTCEVCASRIPRKYLRRHMLTHGDDGPYQCAQCPALFLTASNLKAHMYVHTGERVHKCKSSTTSSTTPVVLRRHIYAHAGQKLHRCSPCPASSQANALRADLREGKRLLYLTRLASSGPVAQQQQQQNVGQEEHRCALCSLAFAAPDKLKKHMQTHAGSGGQKCDFCAAALALGFEPRNFKDHLRTHCSDKCD